MFGIHRLANVAFFDILSLSAILNLSVPSVTSHLGSSCYGVLLILDLFSHISESLKISISISTILNYSPVSFDFRLFYSSIAIITCAAKTLFHVFMLREMLFWNFAYLLSVLFQEIVSLIHKIRALFASCPFLA